jgi:geranylgeranyl diphosphate synthase type II
MSLPNRFQQYLELLNEHLDRSLEPEDADPRPIYKAIRYSLFPGGKRFRPLIAMAGADALGIEVEKILPAASAIEMVHTYSLIHDDLPSMDNDDYRRGKPANHKVFGEAIAILAGDALLTAAFEQIASASYEPAIQSRLIGQLAEAAGTRGMIGGQVMDMVNETRSLSRERLEQLHSMKTAALIRYAALTAPIIAKAGRDLEQSFAEYGSCVGLAFQIVDDVLDIESTSEILGKTAGKDQNTKKVTYPALIGVKESKQMASELIQKACQAVERIDRYSSLAALAQLVLNRNK